MSRHSSRCAEAFAEASFHPRWCRRPLQILAEIHDCSCTGLTLPAQLVAAAGPAARPAAPAATMALAPFPAGCWHMVRLCCQAVGRGLQLHGAACSLHGMVQRLMREATQARGAHAPALQCCCTAQGPHPPCKVQVLKRAEFAAGTAVIASRWGCRQAAAAHCIVACLLLRGPRSTRHPLRRERPA